MTLPVTALAAAICALLLIFMKFKVIGQRVRTETMFGAGEDAKMKMVRGTHANLAENAPIALILMALLEMTSAHHWTLTGLAGLFLIARVLHIYGMYQHHGNGSVRFRQAGVIGTTISIVAMALWVIYLFVTVNL
ncbi:MAPEG family protein [Parasphingorhabdus sp.]|uniref:MAPEG family protein n=1 Tax=Parasphingorhabdus sp. TaxID=2709688 RepID=UPI003A8D4D66